MNINKIKYFNLYTCASRYTDTLFKFIEFLQIKRSARKNLISLCFIILFLPFITFSQVTITKSIESGNDDVEEEGLDGTSNGPGFIYSNSSDLEIVRDDNAGNQVIGLRFTNIAIPKGATITGSYLTFRAVTADSPNTNTGVTNLTIKGQNADNGPVFSTTAFDVSNRPSTSSTVAWSSLQIWNTGVDYTTPSLNPIVQEIVNRSGWSSGNNMVFMISGVGSRSSESFENSGTNQPILTIQFTTINIVGSVTNVTIPQTNDGSINLTLTNGTAPYSYSWSNGATTKDITNLYAGIYTVTVTDFNGATLSAPFEVLDGLVKKQLYLTGVSQQMDRIDPTVFSESLKSTIGLYSPAIGFLNSEYRIFNNTNTFYGEYTSPDGPNRLLLVGISVRNRNDIFTTNVSYNSIPMTLAGTINNNEDALVYIYTLVNPPVGSGNLEVNFNSNVTRAAIIGISTLHGVHQTTPTGPSSSMTTSSNNISLNINSAPGDLVVGVVSKRNASSSFTTPQTQRWNGFSNETRGAANSIIATSNSTTLNWTASNGSGAAFVGVAIKPAVSISNTSFTQTPALCSNLTIKAGIVTVKNFIEVVSGSMPANPNITAILKYDATTILTLTNPTYNSSQGLVTWASNLGSDVVVPSGKAITLEVINNVPLVEFKIQFDHSSKPSMVEFNTSTYINVNSLTMYNAAYPGGSIVNSIQKNSPTYIRSVVSDPFGFEDITALNVNITSPPIGPFVGTSVANTTCTRTYEYLWNTPNTAGDFVISANAKEGYENTVSFTRTANFSLCPLTVTNAVVQNTSCSSPNGTINLSVSGPAGPYTWNWTRSGGSGSGSGVSITNLQAGTYTITVTSSRGCTGTTSATINTPSPPTISGTSTDVSCFLGSNGQINQTISGGSSPYTYVWSNSGITTKDRTGLTANTYMVTVSNSGGCQTTAAYVINQPTSTVVSPIVYHPTCITNGYIEYAVFGGGIEPYTWNWTLTSPSGSASGTGETIPNLVQGNYSITVTSSDGCSGTTSATLTNPSPPVSTGYISHNTCFGGNTGIINQSIIGGTSPFNYVWSDIGSGAINRTGLSAGNYTVTIMDNNACSAVKSYVVTQPTNIIVNSALTQPNCIVSGVIDLSISGGTSPYKLNWNDIQGNDNVEDRLGLKGGNYSVTVTDALGCSATGSYVLNVPDCSVGIEICKTQGPTKYSTEIDINVTSYFWTMPAGATIVSGQNSSEVVINWSNATTGNSQLCVKKTNNCGESENFCQTVFINAVAASVTAISPRCLGSDLKLFGNGGQDYTWTGPNSFTSNSPNPTINNISNVHSGNYLVTVTNSSGCSATSSLNISVLNPPNTSMLVYNATCGVNNGFIDLTVSGSTSPYTFSWSNGRTTEDNTALPKGNYNVTVTSANGCKTTSTGSVGEVGGPNITSSLTHITCEAASSGSIVLNISGGYSPYTYNWSNGVTTKDLISFKSGTYSITVIDAIGCISGSSFTLNQPNKLIADKTKTDVSCFGGNNGTISMNLQGGTSPYSFLWSDGPTSKNRTGLSVGNYTCTITDANSCQSYVYETIVQPLNSVNVNLTTTDVTCDGLNNGLINTIISGGTPPYTFQWSSDTYPLFNSTSTEIQNLSPGDYQVNVTDSKSCQTVAFTTINNAVPLNMSHLKSDLSCNTSEDGYINFSLYGGTGPYSYFWSNGKTTEDISNLSAGSYTVTVQDSKACIGTHTVTITQPDDLTYTLSVNHIICYGEANGSIDLTVGGGTVNYYYNWSNGSSAEDLSGLVAGNYTVTVTDANLCSVVSQINIDQGNPLFKYDFVTDVSCNGENNGAINFTPVGGRAPYTFLWSNGATTEDISNLVAGPYYITLTDINLCNISTFIYVNEPPAIDVNLIPTDVSCYGQTDGSISISSIGGYPGYRYAWTSGSSSQNVSGLQSGQYTVTITDLNGCSTSKNSLVYQPQSLIIYKNIFPNCLSQSNGSIDLIISGGSGIYSYNWSDIGAGSDNRNNLSTGIYIVTVSDHNGCQAIESFEIAPLNVNLAGYNTTCTTDINGGSLSRQDGSIFVTISGKDIPVSYSWSNGENSPHIYGLTSGSYTVTVSSGACNIVKQVSLGSNTCIGPIASDDNYITEINTPLNGNVSLNDYDPNFELPLKYFPMGFIGSEIGQLSWNTSQNGDFIFIPTNNYVGSFTIPYKVCDTMNLCSNANLNIIISKPIIGIAKTIVNSPNTLENETYDFSYGIKVKNMSHLVLSSLNVIDSLSKTLIGSSSFTVTGVSSPSLVINSSYNGTSVNNLLASGNILNPLDSAIINIDIRITPGSKLGPYFNTAIASAISPGSTIISDLSQDGTDVDPDRDGNPYNNSVPTRLQLCPFVYITGSNPICVGDSTTLTAVTGGVWSSSNPSVAQVSESGKIYSLSSGTAYFTFVETESGCTSPPTSVLLVNPIPIISLIGPSSICKGSTTAMNPTSGGTWTSNNNAVASISNSGIVSGLSAGTAQFSYTNNMTSCVSPPSSTVTIRANPDISFVADSVICVGTSSNALPTSGGSWISQNTSVASITNAGAITGLSNGSTSFTFTTSEGCSNGNSLNMIVNGKTVVQLVGPQSICISTTTNLSPNTGGTWTSLNPSIATVSTSGVITGVSQGNVSFTYTNSVTGCVSNLSESITVHPRPTSSLNGTSAICVNSSTLLLPSSGVIWESNNPSNANISSSGIVIGISSGTATFNYTLLSTGCKSDTTPVLTINPKPIVSFAGPNSICVGTNTQMSPSINGSWTSSNNNVATITNSGLVTAIDQGSAKFTFTSNISGCISSQSSSLTVNEKPLVSVVSNSTICQGSTATIFPNSGGTWTSSNSNIASVSNNGIVTGKSAGSASFIFTNSSNGCMSDPTIPINVNAAPVINNSGYDLLCAGYTTNLSTDVDGIWTSSNSNIAQVSSAGLVTGIAAGNVKFTFFETSSGCTSLDSLGYMTVINCFKDDFNVTGSNISVSGNVSINDNVPSGTTYETTPIVVSKPPGSVPTLSINAQGIYNFITEMPGVYVYNIGVCLPTSGGSCPKTKLEINVSDLTLIGKIPVANIDFGVTSNSLNPNLQGNPVIVNLLLNDRCMNGAFCGLDSSSVQINVYPSHGTVSVNSSGLITYTPNPGFTGTETMSYQVCVLGEPLNCGSSTITIDVKDLNYSSPNSTSGIDDFFTGYEQLDLTGNVLNNDFDVEGDLQSVTPMGSISNKISISGGSYYINSNGQFYFTPNPGFYGPTSFVYSVCDNNLQPVCVLTTAYIYIIRDLRFQIRVYLEGAIINNGNLKAPDGRPLMRDNLRSNIFTGLNYLPKQDPYQFATTFTDLTNDYHHVNSGNLSRFSSVMDSATVFSVSGQNAIVDWVFVEVRSKSDSSLVLATRSGLLQRDGDIVDIDGISPLAFAGIGADSYYVVVRHRSHLGAMTQLVPSNSLIDFTKVSTPIFDFGTSLSNGFNYSGLAMNSTVSTGYRALWAGDFDGDKRIKFVNPNDDQNILFFDVFTYPNNLINSANYNYSYGYFQGDYDMNGKTKFDNPDDDKNLLFGQLLLYPLNSGLLSNFNYFIEQVPARR